MPQGQSDSWKIPLNNMPSKSLLSFCLVQQCLACALFWTLIFTQMCWCFRAKACMTHREWREPDSHYAPSHVCLEWITGLGRCEEHTWVTPGAGSEWGWKAVRQVAGDQRSPVMLLMSPGSLWPPVFEIFHNPASETLCVTHLWETGKQSRLVAKTALEPPEIWLKRHN